MPYCPRCGVEADPSVRNCPLCRTEIPELPDQGPGEPAWPHAGHPEDPSRQPAPTAVVRWRVFLAIAAVFATAALAVAAADVATSGGLSWSRWPLTALAAVWGLTAVAFRRYRQPLLWLSAWFIILAVLLALFDLFDDGFLGWFPTLGLPLTALPFAALAGGRLWFLVTRRRGYADAGAIVLLLLTDLVLTDLLIVRWVTGAPATTWSLVCALVLIPLAFLFFFLHYALRWTPDFRRTFHF